MCDKTLLIHRYNSAALAHVLGSSESGVFIGVAQDCEARSSRSHHVLHATLTGRELLKFLTFCSG